MRFGWYLLCLADFISFIVLGAVEGCDEMVLPGWVLKMGWLFYVGRWERLVY